MKNNPVAFDLIHTLTVAGWVAWHVVVPLGAPALILAILAPLFGRRR